MDPISWPGKSDEAHPEVFTKVPPQPDVLKPGQLTKEQVTQFFTEGYLVVENYFDTEKELDPVREDINQLVDDLANRLYKAGKIKDIHKDLGFFDRLIQLEKEFPGANILLHKHGHLPPSFRRLWSNERLLNLVEQLLGSSDIVGHPVWNLRTKTPKCEATTVPWHQDVAYLDKRSYNVLQPTAWIPLLDADEINGCMQVMAGGHRSGKVATHQCCHGGTWYVMLEEDEMQKSLGIDTKKDLRTCPIKYGSFLLINNLIPHRSLNNTSEVTRWSLDLRWQRADRPVAFYDLKNGVRMRSSTNPNMEINWEEFDSVCRHAKSATALNRVTDEFDTTISGLWMKKWEIVHMNRHTESLMKSEDNPISWHSP